MSARIHLGATNLEALASVATPRAPGPRHSLLPSLSTGAQWMTKFSSVLSTGPARLAQLCPSRAPQLSSLPILRDLELNPEVRQGKTL